MTDCGRRPLRAGTLRTIVLASLVLVALVAWAVISLRRPENPPIQPAVATAPPLDLVETFRPQIDSFCGNCHATPVPADFPQAAWHAEVKQGYDFYFDSGRTDLHPPDFDRVLVWFRDQAPEEIVTAPQSGDGTPGNLQFRIGQIGGGSASHEKQPAVSSIKWCRVGSREHLVLLWTDMRTGEICTCDPCLPQSPVLRGLAAHPAHAEPCDLDRDGSSELVVAELGSFQPADHDQGKVLWFRELASAGPAGVIRSGLGRVADVQPGDFDGDGDLDLVVAEFGWRKTGRILLLENQANSGTIPNFQMRVLDSRHGTIHVPPVDLNGDGRLDFVALISQEHETVVAFLNDGAGGFRLETIYSANDPAFGSSGIQLVDLDADGDLDVLYTNGDTFDSFYAKPYHSLRWLENEGTFPFRDQRLTLMPGVHRALAGDLDGDGDLDVVACSLLPGQILGRQKSHEMDSLIWLEQAGRGNFIRHSLERGNCRHAALELGDFDGDGDIDLAVGNFSDTRGQPALSVWWNLRIERTHAPEN
jgi:hypothetical protein